ncbi:unnamed protein product [Closterium sp. Yama58-4]|nr:unnamed protein product [Closterium sp. Yama58-4]
MFPSPCIALSSTTSLFAANLATLSTPASNTSSHRAAKHHGPLISASAAPSASGLVAESSTVAALEGTLTLQSPCFEARLNVGDTATGRLNGGDDTSDSDSTGIVISSSEYNMRMKRAMANPYEYHHQLGMYYTRIAQHLLVGSQPQSPDDIERLQREEEVAVVLNLQQDHDIAYWGVDIHRITHHCRQLGLRHYRRPAVDFDPHSLRHQLPGMVAVIEHHVSGGRTVLVHCTAGLGRAPAAAIAFLFWFRDMDLRTAYEMVTTKRPCGPRWEAIRGATYDLADTRHQHCRPPLEHLPSHAFSDVSQEERRRIQDRVRGLYHG